MSMPLAAVTRNFYDRDFATVGRENKLFRPDDMPGSASDMV